MILLITLVLLSGANIGFSAKKSGPPGPIKMLQISECDIPVNNIDYNMELGKGPDQGDVVSFSYELSKDYKPEDLYLLVTVDQRIDNDWQKAVFVANEPVLAFLNKFAPKIFKDYLDASGVGNSKVYPQGKYKVDGFQARWQDINMPQVLYGRFLLSSTLYTTDQELFCTKIELEVSDPSPF